MRFFRHSLSGLFLVFATLALLLYAVQMIVGAVQERMASDRSAPPARERVYAVNVVPARAGTEVPVLEAFGEIQSRRSLELRAASGGKVLYLSPAFEEGGSVLTGEVLMRIDPSDALAALDRAQSDLLDARAEKRDAARALELAGDELAAAQDQAELRARAFKRQQDLESRRVGTAAAVETAELAAAQARQTVLSRRLALAQAEGRVDQAETREARARIAVANAQRDLEDTELHAPFDGALSEVNVVEGRLVQTNEKLALLLDAARLEVAFRVSTAQHARLLAENGSVINAPVSVRLDVADAEITARGQVTRDGAAAISGQSGRQLFAALETAPGFKPGDFALVQVEELPLENVVRLPASALDAAGTVLVLGAEDRLEALPVTLVRRQGDDVLVRGAGLEGREVVSGRTPLLGAGIRVRPLREGAQVEVSEPETVALSQERRARLVAFVSAASNMPDAVRNRVLSQLEQPNVPVQLVERIESRMGG